MRGGDRGLLESLAQLVDLSLVRRTRGGRFEFPSALLTYSRELLDESGERDLLCRRHAEVLVAEWLPLVIERPMVAYRATYGPIVAEQSDLAVLLDWSARSDAELFSQLIACTYSPLNEVSVGTERMERWRESIKEAAATGPATGRVRTNGRVAAAVATAARGTVPDLLDLALEADTEGDPIFAAWLYASCAVMDALFDRTRRGRVERRLSPPSCVPRRMQTSATSRGSWSSSAAAAGPLRRGR